MRDAGPGTVVAVLATIAITVATPAVFAAPAGAAVPPKPTCATGATPVLYQAQWYCPGTAAGVKSTIYGTGKRILLMGVSVTGIRGTTATVSSTTITTPPCPPDNYCGALVTITVTTISVSIAGLASGRPSVRTATSTASPARASSPPPGSSSRTPPACAQTLTSARPGSTGFRFIDEDTTDTPDQPQSMSLDADDE